MSDIYSTQVKWHAEARLAMQDNERQHTKDYWFAELRSLGIEPKQTNKLNDDAELADLVDNIKDTYFQDYKTAYDDKRLDYVI